jgi:hypothetical protein
MALSVEISSDSNQRDAVELVEKAKMKNILIHVPTILLSASTEFDMAYRPGGNQMPKLSHISENDKRAKCWLLYGHGGYMQRYGVCGGMFKLF